MFKKEDYKNYYENLSTLGQSSFAIIFQGTDKNLSKAIKIYEKERVKTFLEQKNGKIPTEEELQKYFDAFKNEAINMEILQGKNKENENAVILDDCFETDNQFAIVMEKCDNNLYNQLDNRDKPFNSEEIYEILSQLNKSFEIMVENKILHRAIKPQNILLKYLNEEKTKFTVKLKLTEDSCSSNNSGKFLDSNFDKNYRIYSPEVLIEKDFTEESDLWSLGILIYTLYFRAFPFDGISKETVYNNITEDAINNLKKCENEDLNNLIRDLLIIEPNRRISWKEYFIHPFFKKRMDFRIFYDFYPLSSPLGSAAYGHIYKGKDKKSGQEKAIKIYDKNLIRSQIQERYPFDRKRINEELKKIIEGFYNEVNHMEILQKNNENQNTVIFDEYFNTEKEFIIIMELCDSNLLNYFLNEKKQKLNLEEIHEIISQLNNSFKIMVENKILHRAIKPQNILLKYLNKERNKFIVKLKLTDDSGSLNSSNNSISQDKIKDNDLKFYAPEVLEKGEYTEKSDLFSLGILMYYLNFGEYPFEEKKKEETSDKKEETSDKKKESSDKKEESSDKKEESSDKKKEILDKKKEILEKIKKGIDKKTDNSEFDDLLKKLLNENENKRISWENYFNHPFFRTNQDFNKYYKIIDEDKKLYGKLGESGYGIVYKAKDKKTDEMKAIDIVNITTIKNYWKNRHANEIKQPTNDDLKPYYKGFYNGINNMKILQGKNNENQNTVIFNEYFNTKESFAYVMELCDGNLLHYIERNKKNKNLDIKEIKNILDQLNNSFKIMHEKQILHRAIKPENILYKEYNNSKIIFKLKLTDNCCLLKDSGKIEMPIILLYNNLCISAPEVLKGEKFKEESDLWSLGILIYYLKFKKYPFSGKNKDEILKQIETVKPEETNNKVFDDLVKKLLTVNSNKRMSWRTYFDHPFFK